MPLLQLQRGYPDYVGKRFIWAAPYQGPVAYVVGGEVLSFPRFNNYIDSVTPCTSASGNYRMEGIPTSGPAVSGSLPIGFARVPWKARIVVVATGAEVAAGVNLSAEYFQATGFGGVY